MQSRKSQEWLCGLPKRWAERRTCHGSIACCQYVDQPNCNSWNDPHRLWRALYRTRQRYETFKDERGGR